MLFKIDCIKLMKELYSFISTLQYIYRNNIIFINILRIIIIILINRNY